jgi:hypothetical protein
MVMLSKNYFISIYEFEQLNGRIKIQEMTANANLRLNLCPYMILNITDKGTKT